MKIHCSIKFDSINNIIDLSEFFDQIVNSTLDYVKTMFKTAIMPVSHSINDIKDHRDIGFGNNVNNYLMLHDYSLYSFDIDVDEREFNKIKLTQHALLTNLMSDYVHIGIVTNNTVPVTITVNHSLKLVCK